MVKAYRFIQQWNQWLTTHPIGQYIASLEKNELQLYLKLIQKHTVVLLGVPAQQSIFSTDLLSNQFIISPLLNRNKQLRYIESDFFDLAIQSASVDVVVLPHTLELTDNPHKLLIEACRIVKPEGHIIIMGFNSHSLWGLKKIGRQKDTVPWGMQFIKLSQIKKWLQLADFEIDQHSTFLFRPPMQNVSLFNKLNFLETIGKRCYKGFGGIYLLQARAKVIPLTPIRMHWRQQLSGIPGIIKPAPGASIRNHT